MKRGAVKKSQNEQNTSPGIQPVWCSARFTRFAVGRVDYFRWFTEEEALTCFFLRNFDLSDGKITGGSGADKAVFP